MVPVADQRGLSQRVLLLLLVIAKGVLLDAAEALVAQVGGVEGADLFIVKVVPLTWLCLDVGGVVACL